MVNETAECIFVGKPRECTFCLEPRILHCIINKQHLLLTKDGKKRVLAIVRKEISNPRRYKTKSGEEQRPV